MIVKGPFTPGNAVASTSNLVPSKRPSLPLPHTSNSPQSKGPIDSDENSNPHRSSDNPKRARPSIDSGYAEPDPQSEEDQKPLIEEMRIPDSDEEIDSGPFHSLENSIFARHPVKRMSSTPVALQTRVSDANAEPNDLEMVRTFDHLLSDEGLVLTDA